MSRNIIARPGRRHPRALVNAYVNKIVDDEPHLAWLRDISAGGAYLYKLIEPNMKGHRPAVGLEMRLPGVPETIWVKAEVVREDTRIGVEGVALRFVNMTAGQQSMIKDFVDKHTTPPVPPRMAFVVNSAAAKS